MKIGALAMNEASRNAIERLAFGNQPEIALRSSISIGQEAMNFAADRVKAMYIFRWLEREGMIHLITDSFKKRPVAKMVNKATMPAIKRAFEKDLKAWGLEKEFLK